MLQRLLLKKRTLLSFKQQTKLAQKEVTVHGQSLYTDSHVLIFQLKNPEVCETDITESITEFSAVSQARSNNPADDFSKSVS